MNWGHVHSWCSRNIFLPQVIHGPWTQQDRRFRAASAEARVSFQAWVEANPEARRHWVLAELRTIVRWAGTRVPYYRELFHREGFDPRAEFSFADYQRLPALPRETVQSRAADLIADGYTRETMKGNSTGGSSGVPVRFWEDVGSRAWGNVAVEWAFSRVGFRGGDRLGLIWGAQVEPQMRQTLRARIVNWLANQQPNNCFWLSNETLDHIDRRLSAYQPDFLRCYTGALTLLAWRLQQHGKRPTYPRRGIITGAEKLDATQRFIIEDVFKVPVYESYGSRDCGLMAMQFSTADRRLSVIGGNVFLEPFGDPDPVAGSEIVVTQLHRWGMPFLRYRIGDRAHFLSNTADQPTEILEEVTGRMVDHISLPDGRLIHSIQFPHFFREFDIREFQVVQQSNGDVRVLLVAGPNLTAEDLTHIERVLHDNLQGISLSISLVSTIDRTPSGKLRPVISYYRPPNTIALPG
jgi:phenylacetate-CoA ligase